MPNQAHVMNQMNKCHKMNNQPGKLFCDLFGLQSRGKFCEAGFIQPEVMPKFLLSPRMFAEGKDDCSNTVRIPRLCFRRTRRNTPLTQVRRKDHSHWPSVFQPRNIEIQTRCIVRRIAVGWDPCKPRQNRKKFLKTDELPHHRCRSDSRAIRPYQCTVSSIVVQVEDHMGPQQPL